VDGALVGTIEGATDGEIDGAPDGVLVGLEISGEGGLTRLSRSDTLSTRGRQDVSKQVPCG